MDEDDIRDASAGRWTQQEHDLFVEGLNLYSKQWKLIADLIKTRTVVQVRTHAQKYFLKLVKHGRSGYSSVSQGHCDDHDDNGTGKRKGNVPTFRTSKRGRLSEHSSVNSSDDNTGVEDNTDFDTSSDQSYSRRGSVDFTEIEGGSSSTSSKSTYGVSGRPRRENAGNRLKAQGGIAKVAAGGRNSHASRNQYASPTSIAHANFEGLPAEYGFMTTDDDDDDDVVTAGVDTPYRCQSSSLQSLQHGFTMNTTSTSTPTHGINPIPTMFYHDAQLSYQQFQQQQQQQQQQLQQQQYHHITTTSPTIINSMTQPFNLVAGTCDGNFPSSMSQAMGPLQYHHHVTNNPLLGSTSMHSYNALHATMIPPPTSHLNYPSSSISTDVYLDHSFGLGGACDLASVDLHWLNFATESSTALSTEPVSDVSKYNTHNTTTTTNIPTTTNHVVTESEENSAEPDDDSVVSGILEAFAE